MEEWYTHRQVVSKLTHAFQYSVDLRSSDFTLKFFCRVCGLRVRVWGSYRTCRSFEYGYGSVTELPEVTSKMWYRHTELTEVPGGYENMLYPYSGYCGTGLAELTEVPGIRVYGYGGLTELPELPGTDCCEAVGVFV